MAFKGLPENYQLENCVRQRIKCTQKSKMYYIEYDKSDITSMSLASYSVIAKNASTNYSSHEEIQKSFWENLETRATQKNAPVPIYAIDNEITCFPDQWKYFNLSKIQAHESILHRLPAELMPGVNTPYVYVSMANTGFGLHTEDSNVASINVHHAGLFSCVRFSCVLHQQQ